MKYYAWYKNLFAKQNYFYVRHRKCLCHKDIENRTNIGGGVGKSV